MQTLDTLEVYIAAKTFRKEVITIATSCFKSQFCITLTTAGTAIHSSNIAVLRCVRCGFCSFEIASNRYL